jgi:hypothetical protein
MRTLFSMLSVSILLFSCQENESLKSDLTGNESTYPLESSSIYGVTGNVIFKEKTDGSTLIFIDLKGTKDDIKHPVHLHLGNVSTPDADVAALLNPVIGTTGKSETHLTMLSNETPVSYKELVQLNACVKVHLSASGPDRDIVLASGNIGLAAPASNGRSTVSVCKSE